MPVFRGISSRNYWQIDRFGGQNGNCARHSIRPLSSQIQVMWNQCQSELYPLMFLSPGTVFTSGSWCTSNILQVAVQFDRGLTAKPRQDRRGKHYCHITCASLIAFFSHKACTRKNEIAYLPVWQAEWLPAGFTWV